MTTFCCLCIITLNVFHALSWGFFCWLVTSKCYMTIHNSHERIFLRKILILLKTENESRMFGIKEENQTAVFPNKGVNTDLNTYWCKQSNCISIYNTLNQIFQMQLWPWNIMKSCYNIKLGWFSFLKQVTNVFIHYTVSKYMFNVNHYRTGRVQD